MLESFGRLAMQAECGRMAASADAARGNIGEFEVMTLGRPFLVAAVVGYLLVFVLPLGLRPMAMPDETRYAEIPREMLLSGDYITPRLNGLRYFEKPPLGYWCNALAMVVFGENRFAGRFPSAAAAGCSALLIFLLVRRFARDPLQVSITPVAFLISVEVFGLGIFSVLDGLFSMFVTATLTAFLFAYHAQGGRRNVFLTLMGVSCGAAFLTKGFLAFVVPAIVIAPFLVWERRWRLLFTMPWLPLLTSAAVVLPWAITIHFHESDFWNYFVFVEHLNRFAGENAQHGSPFWYFVPVLMLGALPWSPLIPSAVQGLWAARSRDSLVRFALCWFAFPFLFFSASKGKLGTYILPCFAPLAILIVAGLMVGLRQRVGGAARAVGVLVVSGLAACMSVALPFLPLEDWGVTFTGSPLAFKWGLCVSLGAWSIFSAASLATRLPSRFVALFCAGPAIFLLTLHLMAGGMVIDGVTSERFLRAHAPLLEEKAIIVSNAYMAPAVCWAYKREDVLILARGSGELSYGLMCEDSRGRKLSFDDFVQLVTTNAGERQVVLILTEERYTKDCELLPKPRYADIADGFAFLRY